MGRRKRKIEEQKSWEKRLSGSRQTAVCDCQMTATSNQLRYIQLSPHCWQNFTSSPSHALHSASSPASMEEYTNTILWCKDHTSHHPLPESRWSNDDVASREEMKMAPVGGFCTENYANTWPSPILIVAAGSECITLNPQPPLLHISTLTLWPFSSSFHSACLMSWTKVQ